MRGFLYIIIVAVLISIIALNELATDAHSSGKPDAFICSNPTSLKTWEDDKVRPKHLQSVYVCRNSHLTCAVTPNAINCN
jgi:hypothetical protein